MSALLSLAATNALAAGVLAVLAWAAGRVVRRQAVLHGLWLLALLRLVTPPLLPVAILPSPLPTPSWRSFLPPPAPVVVPMSTPAVDEGARRAIPSSPLRVAPPRSDILSVDATPLPAAPVLPAPAFLRSSRGPVVTSGSVGAAAADVARPRAAGPPDGLLALAAGGLGLGTLAIAVLTVLRFRRFRRLLLSARPAAAAVSARTSQIARRMELRTVPPVLLLRATAPPMLWPSRRGPLLLLPEPLLEELTADERDALIAHELAHVRRRDHWVRFVEIAATALFWWYPVAWWARTALRRAEERCCDEWVLRVLPSSADAYASGLLKSLELVSAEAAALPIGASGAGPVQDLEARLKEILMTRPLPRLAAPVRLGLAAAALAGLAVFPTPAQSRPSAIQTPTSDVAPVAAAAPLPAAPATPVTARTPAVTASPHVAPVPATPRARPRPAPSADARPVVHPQVGIVGPTPVPSSDVALPSGRPAIAGGVPGGVPGGIAGGVPSGVPGGVAARLPGGTRGSTDAALASTDDDDPALEAERRELHEQRRRLREQEIELERRMLDVEARAEQKRMAQDATRLRSENRAADADRLAREARLHARRLELQRQRLQLELENTRLEAQMEEAARALENGAEAGAAAELHRSREALEGRQHALETEMEKAEQEMQRLEAEARVAELRQSTGELERSLTEHMESLREALPSAGEGKAEMEKEILRLQSALDALAAPSTGTKVRRSPAPDKAKTRQPAQPAQTPQPAQP